MKRAEAVAKLIELQPEQLEEWDGIDGFTCQLPPTSVEGRHALTSLSALVRRPDASELPDLVFDETGSRNSLTPNMVLALKRNGRFSFPSAAHPPLEHVWQLTSWLQRSSVRIRTNFLVWIECAVDQMLVHCKRRFSTSRKQENEDQKEGRNTWLNVQFTLWKGVKTSREALFVSFTSLSDSRPTDLTTVNKNWKTSLPNRRLSCLFGIEIWIWT